MTTMSICDSGVGQKIFCPYTFMISSFPEQGSRKGCPYADTFTISLLFIQHLTFII
jgi:hypothetical protein